MRKEYTCVICPNGCNISVEEESDIIKSISGNLCKRGEEYVRQEMTDPRRTIATSVLVQNGELPLVSVRTNASIPKAKIFDVMQEIKKVRLKAPVIIGQIVIKNVLGTGADVVVTKDVSENNKKVIER